MALDFSEDNILSPYNIDKKIIDFKYEVVEPIIIEKYDKKLLEILLTVSRILGAKVGMHAQTAILHTLPLSYLLSINIILL